jgi:hypothetical protein
MQHAWEEYECMQVLIGKFEGDRQLGASTHRWLDIIKMHLRETEWGYGLNSSGSGWRPVTCSCEHGNELLDSIQFWEFLGLASHEGFGSLEFILSSLLLGKRSFCVD